MRERELTVRAVLTGVAIGGVLAVGNVYMGLKTGWGDSGNIIAALLGFSFLSGRCTKLENNIIQTVASSAAGMCFTAGLVGAFPALHLLGHSYPALTMMMWSVAIGGLGIGIGVLLRPTLIVEEKLPFPTGMATAEFIDAIHAARGTAIASVHRLLISFVVAGVLVWLREGRPAWIPQTIIFPFLLFGIPSAVLSLGASASPLLLGTGLLVGFGNGASLLLGSVAAWWIIAPVLVRYQIVAHSDYQTLASWLLWPGVALMVANAGTTLLLKWRTIGRGLQELLRIRRSALSTSLIPAVLVVVATVVTARWFFGLHPALVTALIALSVLLAAVCGRAAGETDIAPITQMGQLTQILWSTLGCGSGVDGIIGASAVAGSATQTSQLLWSFKTGAHLGASPRAQVHGQIIGMVAGAIAAVPIYLLLRQTFALGSASLPAPTAIAWKALAEVSQGGIVALPRWAATAAGAGVFLGIAFAVCEHASKLRMPSALAMGVAFLTPASYTLTIFAGSVLLVVLRRLGSRWNERDTLAVATGAIAGESLVGVLCAVLVGMGILAAR